MKKVLATMVLLIVLAVPMIAMADVPVVATDVILGDFIVVIKGQTGSVEWAGMVNDATLCAKTHQTAPCVVFYGPFNGINIQPNGQGGAGVAGQEGVVFGPNQVKSQ